MKNYKLIVVGLGNPGKEYVNTRHNAGFWVLDELIKTFDGAGFKEIKKFKLEDIEIELEIYSKKVLLIKPLGFMNKSGEVLKKYFDYKEWDKEELLCKLLIVLDDADQLEGKFKLTNKGGAGGHKGLENIFNAFSSDEIKRIKIGIRPENNEEKSETFVLGGFNKEGKLAKKIQDMPEIITCLTKKGLAFCQSFYH